MLAKMWNGKYRPAGMGSVGFGTLASGTFRQLKIQQKHSARGAARHPRTTQTSSNSAAGADAGANVGRTLHEHRGQCHFANRFPTFLLLICCQ